MTLKAMESLALRFLECPALCGFAQPDAECDCGNQAKRDAIRALVAELELMVPRWVPVSEGLPNKSVKSVWVYDKEMKNVCACSFPYGWEGMLEHKYISHWMLQMFPPPPTLNEEGQ